MPQRAIGVKDRVVAEAVVRVRSQHVDAFHRVGANEVVPLCVGRDGRQMRPCRDDRRVPVRDSPTMGVCGPEVLDKDPQLSWSRC